MHAGPRQASLSHSAEPSFFCLCDSWQVHEDKVAASATCSSSACDRIALKIINFSSYEQRVAGN
jgi:hypothetical protein